MRVAIFHSGANMSSSLYGQFNWQGDEVTLLPRLANYLLDKRIEGRVFDLIIISAELKPQPGELPNDFNELDCSKDVKPAYCLARYLRKDGNPNITTPIIVALKNKESAEMYRLLADYERIYFFDESSLSAGAAKSIIGR